MSNRYWVGNGGTWSSSDTSHWSATDGGSPGASVPGQYDDAIFNANSFSSGSQTVIVAGPATYAKSINFTGVSNTPHVAFSGGNYDIGQIVLCGGDFTLTAGMTIDENFILQPQTASLPLKVTSAGKRLGQVYLVTELLDDLNCFYLCVGGSQVGINGTFTANGHDIDTDFFQISGSPSASASIDLGGSTITISNTLAARNGWNPGPGRFICWTPWSNSPIAIDSAGTTIVIPAAAASNNIRIEGEPTSQIVFSGAWSLSCPGGTVIARYVTLEDASASGGAQFISLITRGCIDAGGNSGWEFDQFDGLITFKLLNYIQTGGIVYKSPQVEVNCKRN